MRNPSKKQHPNLINMPSKKITNKPLNRQKLIDATLRSIVDFGLEQTSISRILSLANLSRGMVNLHFKSKENLLLEALKYYTENYNNRWYSEVDKVSLNHPAKKLQAMIQADLSTNILNNEFVIIWYEFRSKARTNSEYQVYTDTRYERYRKTFYSVCSTLAKLEGSNTKHSRSISHGLIAMMEGMWVDYYLHSDSFDRISAERTFYIFLSSIFPSQFTKDGTK